MKQRLLYLTLSSLVVTACANNAPAPVLDISDDPANLAQSDVLKPDPSNKRFSYQANPYNQQDQKALVHKVHAGETLFSIAWRYSLDFKQLSDINRLENYTIYPGQALQLKRAPNLILPATTKDNGLFDSESLIVAINSDFFHKATATTSLSKAQSAVKPSNRVANVTYPANAKVISNSNSKAVRPNARLSSASNKKVKRWIWPVNGKLIGRFSNKSTSNKGLDIVAKRGTPVRATAGGKVVYSGSGLRGYGQLVIIKHNDAYLSAYAHNEKIHVEENEYVKAGQRIADLGSSDSDKNKLHFEIRYKGKPVDPLKYLPKMGNL
ncbi:MAG: peptidoglycan DD-metalloendopeptidase family protein [Enterobacterales bacterium]|nr:peptidoglycan DD-metalloendopeptidase family protein [Enterobacterales bacterium]